MTHFRLFAILLLLVAGSTTVVSGQTQQEPTLDMEFTDIPLSEAISRIEKNTRYTFFYDAKQTDLSQHVSLKAKRMPISAALKEMLAPTGLNFTITERQIALIPARKSPARQRTINRRRQRLVRNAAGGRGRHARGRQHPRCGNGSQRQLHARRSPTPT